MAMIHVQNAHKHMFLWCAEVSFAARVWRLSDDGAGPGGFILSSAATVPPHFRIMCRSRKHACKAVGAVWPATSAQESHQ